MRTRERSCEAEGEVLEEERRSLESERERVAHVDWRRREEEKVNLEE